jgi:hypothetical protein
MEDRIAADLRSVKHLLWVVFFLISITGARLYYVAPVGVWDLLMGPGHGTSISLCRQ